MRLKPAVRIRRRAGEGKEGWEMLEHARDEMMAEPAHAEAPARVVGEIAPARPVPQAPVHVAAVARLIRERLGREGGVEAVAIGDGTNRFPIEDLTIGGGQRGRVTDGQLLLPVAELRIVLLELYALRLQGRHHVVHDESGRGHADGGEAQRLVEGREGA